MLFQSARPFDVQFRFPRSGQELWASSDKLKQVSAYWKADLNSGFKESQPVEDLSSTQSTYQPDSTQDGGDDPGWSDSDDEAVAEEPKPAKAQYVISVTDHSFSTYMAVLVWIWRKEVNFAAFKSTLAIANAAATAHAGADSAPPAKRRKPNPAAGTSGLAPVVSPKSVYRLAHKLQIGPLRLLALEELKKGLTVDNVAHELLSSTAQLYEEVRAAVVDFVVANRAEVVGSEGMKAKLRKGQAGEMNQLAPIWATLAERALAAKASEE